MKIVMFKNGKYGIRKWSLFYFGYVFLDLKDHSCWWSNNSRWMLDCQGDLETVERIYELLTDKGLTILK